MYQVAPENEEWRYVKTEFTIRSASYSLCFVVAMLYEVGKVRKVTASGSEASNGEYSQNGPPLASKGW